MISIQSLDLSDYKVSESDKEKIDYLVNYTDSMILEMVSKNSSRRKRMIKMRDMYEGYRDPKEYKYLTANYGIGNAAELKFIPIVRNRIDVLIGILSSAPFDFHVSVMDKDTMDWMMQEKTFSVLQEVYNTIQQTANKISADSKLKDEKGNPIIPYELTELIAQTQDRIDKEWRSVYVESCNNMIRFFQEDVDTDLAQKRRLLMEDLCVTGECGYRVKVVEKGKAPVLEILIPENLYYDIRRDQKYFKESQRAVYVRYMTKQEVLNEYGHLMNSDDMEDLFVMPSISRLQALNSAALLEQDTRTRDGQKLLNTNNYVVVYECEWVANNEYKTDKQTEKDKLLLDGPNKFNGKRYRKDRYQMIRVGSDIYLEGGKSQFVRRSKKNPDFCTLTFNGVRFSDRNGEPYSLMFKCKDIQDTYDILYYQRDNLIANSGVKGTYMNVAALPDFLGTKMMERVTKYIALKKQGVAVVDPSMDGAEKFNNYGAFDESLDGNAINAMNGILAQLENEASKITGVTPQMLGFIEQREAVSNVKAGVSNASLVTKNLFDTHDLVTKHLLTDLICASQIIYEQGFSGGFNSQLGYLMFKILPEHFCPADYNIHVVSISNEYSKIQEVKVVVNNLINAQVLTDPTVIFKIMKSESLNEIISIVERELSMTSGFNSKLKDLNGQLEQSAKQVQELEAQLKKFNDIRFDLENRKVLNEEFKAKSTAEIGKRNLDYLEDSKVKELELKKENVQLERDQLFLGVGREREVSNKNV